MFKYFVLAALIPACVLGLTVNSCPNGAPVPTSVTVVGCTQQPCDVINGQVLSFTASFNNPAPTTRLVPDLAVFLAIIQIPFPLPPGFEDGCNFLTGGGSCPLAGGEQLTASVNFPVDTPITGVTVTIQFSLLNDAGNPLFCLRVDGRIIAA